jgi:hypothetical protein
VRAGRETAARPGSNLVCCRLQAVGTVPRRARSPLGAGLGFRGKGREWRTRRAKGKAARTARPCRAGSRGRTRLWRNCRSRRRTGAGSPDARARAGRASAKGTEEAEARGPAHQAQTSRKAAKGSGGDGVRVGTASGQWLGPVRAAHASARAGAAAGAAGVTARLRQRLIERVAEELEQASFVDSHARYEPTDRLSLSVQE